MKLWYEMSKEEIDKNVKRVFEHFSRNRERIVTIDDLIPLLKKGWVAYDGNGWAWFSSKPVCVIDDDDDRWMIKIGNACNLSGKGCPFKIEPFEKSWEDSLRRIK